MPSTRACLLAFAVLFYTASPLALELETCTLKGSAGIASVEARCGWFERAENPDAPDGAKIRIRLAVVPALSPNPKPDALTVINGGPGGSSLDMYADMAGTFASIRRERDILIIDQRGTGASNPLDCEQLEKTDLETEIEVVREATRACLTGLTGDPRYYTTSVAVRDLEAARVALDYSTLNVYGVSYGTRVAQHYARRYPANTRTLIIDGVAPPEVPLGPNAALNAQRTLDRLFSRCAEDAACSRQFPEIETQLDKLMARLENSDIPVEIAHPVTGIRESIDLTTNHLLVTLRMLSYVPETASLIPLIIDEAERKQNYVPLAANALRIETQLLGALRFGMHNAVICTEDAPYFGRLDRLALEATYIGPAQAESLVSICTEWPAGSMDDDLRQPLAEPIPTLILSGEEDPITPPSYGDMADASLPDSLHLIGSGQGHGVVARGCFPKLVADFIDSGELADLETDCLDRLTHLPFFLNLMGPVAAPDVAEGAP